MNKIITYLIQKIYFTNIKYKTNNIELQIESYVQELQK